MPEAYREQFKPLFEFGGQSMSEFNRQGQGLALEERMERWWRKAASLPVEHGLTKTMVDASVAETDTPLREGYADFCQKMNEHGIPLTVLSAGITQYVEAILAKSSSRCDSEVIISNDMIFDAEGKLVGWSDLIHSENKKHASHSFRKVYEERVDGRGVILLGDSLGDAAMVRGAVYSSLISIGFLNKIDERVGRTEDIFMETFDVVLTDDAPLDYVVALIDECTRVEGAVAH